MLDKIKKKLNKKEEKVAQPNRPMDNEILKANIELEMLESKAHKQLRREVNTVIETQKKDKRAIERLKNTYYALKMIETAKERMNDIGSSYELNELLKNISKSLKSVNSLEGKTDDVNAWLLRWRERTMNKNVVSANEGNMREYFSKPIEELITEDELDKLLNRYQSTTVEESEASSFVKEAGRAAMDGTDSMGFSGAEIVDMLQD